MFAGAGPTASSADCASCRAFFDAIGEFSRLHAVKCYRLPVDVPERIPVLPCLDHEAMLHERIHPHAAAYIEDLEGGGLHEVVCVPAQRRIEIDIVSTAGEHTDAAHDRLVDELRTRFPEHHVAVHGPSPFRGDRRVARACRAQVPLRDVLLGQDFPRLHRALERLRTIGALMEKESRVASWSVRTVTGPMLAVAGVLSFQVLETLTPRLGAASVERLQYVVVGTLGAVFLYYGLKAVHLTEMANRVWKRCAEYGLILKDRERLQQEHAPVRSAISPGAPR